MFYISCEGHFDSAHFLKAYEGKCRNIHGHRWKVVCHVKDEELKESGQERGMVIDFGSLKSSLKKICDSFDHKLIIEKDSISTKLYEALIEENFSIVELPFRPTAEEFSVYIAHKLIKEGYRVKRVEVYETPTNIATFEVD